jgi:hypothetical protein
MMGAHWILLIYRAGLALFPASYRREFGAELLYAVSMAVEQARSRGRLAVLLLGWRELRDLPGACLREHLSERKEVSMRLQPGAYLPEGPFKLWQLVAVFLPFAIGFLAVALSLSAGARFYSLLCGIGVALLVLLLMVWIGGIVKAFPTWALPSLGLILLIITYGVYLLSQAFVLMVLRPFWGSFWPEAISLRLLMYAQFNLVYVAIAACILLLLMALSSRLLKLARQDWSLLSLLVFNLAFPYVLVKDEYRGLEPYQLASLLILAAGVVCFILLPARGSRLLALLAATCLALTVMSAGIYVIFPNQYFADDVMSFRVWEALQPVLDLPALLIILCLPLLVRRLPESFGFKHVAAAG